MKPIGLLYTGNALDILKEMPSNSIHTVCTSPPYFGLRSYSICSCRQGRIQHATSTLVGTQAGTPSEFSEANPACTKCSGTGHISGTDHIWGGDSNCEHDWLVDSYKTQTGGTGAASAKQKTNAGTQGGVQESIESGFCLFCNAWLGSLGNEPTPELFIEHLVLIFREVRRVLRSDGTLWCNIGDSYAAQRSGTAMPAQTVAGGIGGKGDEAAHRGTGAGRKSAHRNASGIGLKHKDLIGIPWMLAFALRADGWYLRQDIIWCLSGGAFVYARSRKGDMPTMIKDLVRLDPSTVKLWNGKSWTQVKSWTESLKVRDGIELVLRSGERIGCTPAHVWPTQRGLVRSDEIVTGDVIESCFLPEPANAKCPEYLTDGALRLCGLYLAEGSMSADVIQLAFHSDEIGWLDGIKDTAKHYGGTVTHTIDGNKLAVRIYSRILRAILVEYIGGHDAHDKHITNAAWRLPNASLKHIAVGYLDGDGHNDAANNRIRLGFCRNYNLEQTLRTLAARLNAYLTLNPSTARYQGGTKPSFRGEWRWDRITPTHGNVRDRGEVLIIRKSRARKYWDIEVDDAPNLFSLASGILTHNSKRNCMPESVTDRCVKSHEYVFLLSKEKEYFFDRIAIREPAVTADHHNKYHTKKAGRVENNRNADNLAGNNGGLRGLMNVSNGMRNKRSVWETTSAPFKGAHFATFPPALIEPMIIAGTSEYGCCASCGAPYERIIEKETSGKSGVSGKSMEMVVSGYRNDGNARMGESSVVTVGWKKSCKCASDDVVPCTVLDCFSGAATTGLVALGRGLNYTGLEQNADYNALAEKRLLDAGLDCVVI